jgi:hypothetical protein
METKNPNSAIVSCLNSVVLSQPTKSLTQYNQEYRKHERIE